MGLTALGVPLSEEKRVRKSRGRRRPTNRFEGRRSNSPPKRDDQTESIKTVSYTHLTLPTNREV